MNEAFRGIALFVEDAITGSGARLIAAAGNGGSNSSTFQIAANLPTALAFVSQDALWPQLGTPSPHALDCPLLHHDLELRRFVTLTCSQHKRQ